MSTDPKRPNELRQLDPDPVTILLSVAGAVGGLLPLVEMARDARNTPSRVRARVVDIAGRLGDDLRHMEVDLALLREVVDASGGSSLRFRLGSQLYLTTEQFRRYRNAADQLVSAAARSVKRIHDLEGSLGPDLFGPDVLQPLGLAADIQGQLNSLLDDRTVTVEDAMRVLRVAIDAGRGLLAQLEERLHQGS